MNSASTQTKSELRKQQILKAARCCFKRQGFHGASMSEIAKTFGMSAGHIYNYFENKEAIIEAIVAQDRQQTIDRLEEIKGEKDILKAMLANVESNLQERLKRSCLETEILAESCRNPKIAKIVQESDAQVRQRLESLLKKALNCMLTPISEGELSAKVAVLLGLFEGMTLRGIRQPNIDQVALSHTLRDQITQLMRTEPH